MEISIRPATPAIVIRIIGSVDGLSAEDLQTAFAGELGKGATKLVADFAGVDYTSSAGLRVLLAVVKEARQRGGDLRIAAARPAVLRVLKMSGFTGILKIFPDTDAAIASFAA